MKNRISNQAGYSILELLIAISIFSVILLISTASMLYIGRMYHKAGIVSRTQETSQLVVEDIAQAIQFSSLDFSDTPSTMDVGGITYYAYCIGNNRYTFATDIAKTASNRVLWRDIINGGTVSSCPVNDTFTSGSDLLGENMRIPTFTIDRSGGAATINIVVAYGDETFLFNDPSDPSTGCVSVDVGGQFCAVSRNMTTVVNRLRN